MTAQLAAFFSFRCTTRLDPLINGQQLVVDRAHIPFI
jgi:hypothetical protein